MANQILINNNLSNASDFLLKEKIDCPRFQIQNRRFLGNKFKLLNFIEEIVTLKCVGFESFCDIFAGTGVTGEHFNEQRVKIISNDLLYSNFVALKCFLGSSTVNLRAIQDKIYILNNLKSKKDNYFSLNYGNTYFTLGNARKIGEIRERIERISDDQEEKNILITSLLYAADKVANTVGHYDAFRAVLDSTRPLRLMTPDIKTFNNGTNEIYNEDSNKLIRNIESDVLYLDPPYNSRQYCDAYHLLENLVTWGKPSVFGKAKKMDRTHLKSAYCFKNAGEAFADLILNAKTKHILVSYNNTGESKDCRSNARISDDQLISVLKLKGKVDIFEKRYKAFTTGKSITEDHAERIFYCKVKF